MALLNLFEPTRERGFTYYDRCAIALDAYELQSTRLRILVDVVGCPLYPSLNLKYPVPQSWYGYFQGFWQEYHSVDVQIKYPRQIVYDNWSEHGALSHQLYEVFYRMFEFIRTELTATSSNDSLPEVIIDLIGDVLSRAEDVFECLIITPEGGLEPPYLNTFQQPINVIRFNFPLGTVFNVYIQAWNMDVAENGVNPGNPDTNQPYDVEAPQAYLPERTPGGNDPETSYGPNPLPSSPIDPNLDPLDFSNAPLPEPPEITCLRVAGSYLQRNATTGNQTVNVDFVVGCFEEPYTYELEYVADSTESPPRPLYRLRVRDIEGTLLAEPDEVSNYIEGSLVYTRELP